MSRGESAALGHSSVFIFLFWQAAYKLLALFWIVFIWFLKKNHVSKVNLKIFEKAPSLVGALGHKFLRILA